MIAVAASALGLRIFFGFLLVGVVTVGIYVFRIREKLFSHRKGDSTDSYASSNLRMWLVLLVWLHAVVILTLMIFEV